MKKIFVLLFSILYFTTFAQTRDTLKLYDAYCESNNPHEIDTTIFTYQFDTLYIRNVHNGICAADMYRAVVNIENDTLKIDIINLYGDCTGDCSMGYTIKIQIESFDTLNLKILDENFKVVKSDIVMSSEQQILQNVKVFPNPVEDRLIVVGEGIREIKILDLNGNVLIRKLKSFNNIDLSNLKSGTYIVSIHAVNYNLTKKIIKK